MHAVSPRRLVALDDKYLLQGERVFLTGIQALVRLPLLRRQLDAALGLNTAGFISGYRGSPLGGYDKQLAQAGKLLVAQNIVAQPAINEDLAVTAVWGTQQVGLQAGARYDGVFGIWYGKGPGVDRSGDAFKHANFAGTARHGGVLAFAGDDHACKSSTMPNQSDFAFIDAEMPVLAPADVAELLEFGAKGLDLSRFAGLWVGMKTIADLMDCSATVLVDPARYATVLPSGVALPPDGLNIRLIDTPQAQEERHRHFRLPAAQAFARANGFDRIMLDGPRARLGIVASGKAYALVRQALRDLGLSDAQAGDLGIRLYKVGLAWPLDPVGARAFAQGLEEVIVVEERRDVIEHQLKAMLYDLPSRPRIVGKQDEQGRPLVRDLLDLDSSKVAQALYARFPEAWRTERMRQRLDMIGAPEKSAETVAPLHQRGPHFCSGCPHNSSTKLPEGSRATAGIGCHFLVQWMDRRSESCSHMGGEGVTWMGQAPFTEEPHMFANLGDGTYYHSGVLAIRQAVAASLNITYKLLYNDAVAMTGGQQVDGPLTVPRLIAQLVAEGVGRIALVSDDPERHRGDPLIPSSVSFDARDRLDAVQRGLREYRGVSVLVFDQTCATETRRRRKRQEMPAAPRRVFINEAVCEGCGDCSRASNCLSVEPVETELGRKRRINQSSCNQDVSCIDGFCPSFVSVQGGKLRRGAGADASPLPPAPDVPELGPDGCNILLAGIGGQGVTALAAILGMAAHIDGREVRVVDQLGMAQKGGGVFSHIRIGRPGEVLSPRIGAGQADLLLAADLVVAHGKAALPACDGARSVAVVDAKVAPTAEFVRNNAVTYDRAGMLKRLGRNCRRVDQVDAAAVATATLGDAIYANIFLLGHAWQNALVPVSLDAIEQAIALNGVDVEKNREAFGLGRRAAVQPAQVETPVVEMLDSLIARRSALLVAYQDEAYAETYRRFLARVREAERPLGRDTLTHAVARGLHKLMAYKDEYEVARLYTDGAFAAALRQQFEGDVRLELHLAPPLLVRRDPDTGKPVKRRFSPWMLTAMRGLARLKRLRGTRFDPFGYTEERTMERALIGEYRDGLARLLAVLTPANHAILVEYAEVAQSIRGFGHVKQANVAAARQRWAELEAKMRYATEPMAMAAQ